MRILSYLTSSLAYRTNLSLTRYSDELFQIIKLVKMFTRQNYNKLNQFNNSSTPCVSLYIPTYRSGNGQEDRLRLKNAISEAIGQLTDEKLFPDTVMSKQDAQRYLNPVELLLDKEDLWKNLSDGMVIFLNEEMIEYYTVPVDFQNFVFVGKQFYLRHLLPILDKDNKFFVLALSQNEVRFFEARENSITPVIIQDLVPQGMSELIGAEDKEQSLQMHSGSGNAIFHGQGTGKDDKKKELKKYFKDVDDGLMTMLHDETAPMVIYAVDYEVPMYKSISKYSNVFDGYISGNPEQDDSVLIHERAWTIMKEHFRTSQTKQREEFNQYLTEDRASIAMPLIVAAAYNGKIEKLYVDSNTDEVWGHFDPAKNKVVIHKERQADSEALLNATALATFNSGGSVHNIPRTQFPNLTSQLNAIYRY